MCIKNIFYDDSWATKQLKTYKCEEKTFLLDPKKKKRVLSDNKILLDS